MAVRIKRKSKHGNDGASFQFRDVASTGGAADSADTDEYRSLPRLLRYAMLVVSGAAHIRERLAAEINEFFPALPETMAWIHGSCIDNAIALANKLDRQATHHDKSCLKSLADCVRLLSLETPFDQELADQYGRIAKALLLANDELPRSLDLSLASKVEGFVWAFAALPYATCVMDAPSSLAYLNAYRLGSQMARRRVERTAEAEANHFRAIIEEKSEKEKEATKSWLEADTSNQVTKNLDDALVVCDFDAKSITSSDVRDVIAPHKALLGKAIPLTRIPDLQSVRATLIFEFPYAIDVVDHVLADLANYSTVRIRPLLLVGEPGGGKSRFARRLGESLGVPIWRTDASLSDGSVFGGTARRWQSCEPCHPFIAIARSKVANPYVIIDELDKAATRQDYGRLWDSLLAFLEDETACRYPDPALQMDLNLSQVSYVATANSLDPIPAPLRDRFRVVDFPKPTIGDLQSLSKAIFADISRERGFDPRWIEPLSPAEEDLLRRHWPGESIRPLRRLLEVILRVRDELKVTH
jgi:ATP-dependent Lon protease